MVLPFRCSPLVCAFLISEFRPLIFKVIIERCALVLVILLLLWYLVLFSCIQLLLMWFILFCSLMDKIVFSSAQGNQVSSVSKLSHHEFL